MYGIESRLQIGIKSKITRRGATTMTLANPIKLVTLGPHGLLSRTKESTTLSKTANNGACNKLTLISLISLTESRWRWTSGDFKSVFAPRVVLATAGPAQLVTSPQRDFAFAYRNNKC